MGSENRADQPWDFLSRGFMGQGDGKQGGSPTRRGSRIIGVPQPMNDSQILSTFQETPASVPRARVLVFDACHLGVILRAVLFVEAVMAVGAMFGAADHAGWLLRMSVLTAAALPAALAWLDVECA